MNLSKFFDPRAVALIGASAEEGKVGNFLLKNLLAGKKRKIFPINPKHQEILGQRCWASVGEIKEKIDVALIAVKAEIVPTVLADCGRKNIPFAIIISAGFKEIGEAGKILEEKIKTIATEYNINILGPNCLGIIDATADLNSSFTDGIAHRGKIAFVSQSGAIGSAILDWAKDKNVGLSRFVSLGNEAGLTESDFLEFLADDRETDAVLVYMEGLSDGGRFLRAARKVTKKKPMVILEAGRTGKGKKAATSHTGSLATEDNIFRAVCRQYGAIMVEDLRGLFNLAKLFNAGIFEPLTDIAVITNGGGPSIVMADLLEMSGHLRLAELSEKTKNELKKVLPLAASVGNPIDVLGDALNDRYENAIKLVVADKAVKGIVVILTPQKMTDARGTAKLIVKYNMQKPIIPIFLGGRAIDEARKIFIENKIASFGYPQDAAEALEALAFSQPRKIIKKLIEVEPEGKCLGWVETAELFFKYNLKTSGIFVNAARHSVIPAKAGIHGGASVIPAKGGILSESLGLVGAPAVMKVVSPEIIHKTDAGAVVLNISTVGEAEKAWNEIITNIKISAPNARVDGMILQPMLYGREVIIGMKRDRVFGPIMIFGLGGIHVEVFKDISMRAAPLTPCEAEEMIKEIKGAAILEGARGEKGVDEDALVDILVSLSNLALEHPEITAIDLNPVIANDRGAVIADARVIV